MNRIQRTLIVLLFCGMFQWANAQLLDYNNKVEIVLNDGLKMILYGRASSLSTAYSGEYFYLPLNLKLGVKPDGTPEFLFVKYTTEEKADQGGTQGAIMHFLMEWGLTVAQVTEANAKLKAKLKSLGGNYAGITNPQIMGPVDVSAADNGSFRVISATLSDDKSAKLITSGKAATMPGQKVAVASKMDKYSAQLLAATFEKNRSISDVSLEMNFKYNVLFPAVDGSIILDWSKINYSFENFSSYYEQQDERIKIKYKQYFLWWKTREWTETRKTGKKIISQSEAHTMYEFMCETKAIDIRIDKNVTDSKIADDVVENFMQIFMSAIADADTGGGDEGNGEEGQAPTNPLNDQATKDKINAYGEVRYSFNSSKTKTKIAKKTETYNLKLRIAMPMSCALTGNLASWYDGVKHNKKCVSSVNLNDKFFQHRDINFVVDNKVKDVFETEVNYVTVNVRKKRSNGNDYTEQKTIDWEYMKKNGAVAQFTYARGEDKNSDDYQYKVQFSLRGGVLYPENPQWQKGDWQGVTLTCPMVPRNMEFEADLEELKKADITRATLQMRYMKHGQEFESNIPITVSKGEALVSKKIFIDEDTPGYAYRLILTHKEKGKLATEWDTKINDDYVYAAIPQKLIDNDKEFWDKLIDQGKTILEPNSDGSVKTGNEILGQFLDVIKIFVDKK
jgi:hypothetical protein